MNYHSVSGPAGESPEFKEPMVVDHEGEAPSLVNSTVGNSIVNGRTDLASEDEAGGAPNGNSDEILLEVEIEVEVEEEEEEEYVAIALPLTPYAAARAEAQSEFDRLFAEWKITDDPKIRERLILMHRNLVTYLARRFMDRGELFEDVVQIGLVGLINALDAFEPTRGVKFSTFATPTIAGEIRRYFRDKVSGMRVPRRMQEMYSVIQGRIEELTQKLDRSPTYSEIAFSLQIEVEEVIETLELSNALDPMSLDDAVFGDKDPSPTFLADTIGGLDPALESYEEHAALQMALSRLTEKERRVLEMAYFHGHSQAEIARRLGVSQMHISRLLRKALAQLRHLLEDV